MAHFSWLAQMSLDMPVDLFVTLLLFVDDVDGELLDGASSRADQTP